MAEEMHVNSASVRSEIFRCLTKREFLDLEKAGLFPKHHVINGNTWAWNYDELVKREKIIKKYFNVLLKIYFNEIL